MQFKCESTKIDACAKQIYSCEKILERNVHEGMELVEKLRRMNHAESFAVVCNQMKNQMEELELQKRLLCDMENALRKANKIYQKGEEDIIRYDETPVKRYKENLGMVKLPKTNDIPIILTKRR